jgi:methylamine dehydrogenase heavy chain
VTLDDKGRAASSKTVARCRTSIASRCSGTPAIVGKTAWFVSFYGMIQGFDLSGE